MALQETTSIHVFLFRESFSGSSPMTQILGSTCICVRGRVKLLFLQVPVTFSYSATDCMSLFGEGREMPVGGGIPLRLCESSGSGCSDLQFTFFLHIFLKIVFKNCIFLEAKQNWIFPDESFAVSFQHFCLFVAQETQDESRK